MKKHVRGSLWTTFFVAPLTIALLSVHGTESRPMAALPVDQPTLITAVSPVFPPTAVASNTSGTVSVEVQTNAAGEVTSARSESGHPLLRNAAEDAARRWRFTSATSVGTVHLTFVFRIMPKGTSAQELTSVFAPPYQVEVRHQPYEPITQSDPRSDEHRRRKPTQ
jgi:TonB family protein